MSYYVPIGEGAFAIKKARRSRKLLGTWSAEFGNPYSGNPVSGFLAEKGFFRLRKSRSFSLYFDNGDKKFNKKTDQLLSRVKLSNKDFKQMRKAETGSILFDYANWLLPIDSCSSEDSCWGEEFSYHLRSDQFTISGTIKDDLGHQLFNDYL